MVRINLGFYYPSSTRGYRTDVIALAAKEFIGAASSQGAVVWVSRAYREKIRKKHGNKVYILDDDERDEIELQCDHKRPSAGLSTVLFFVNKFPRAKILIFGFNGYKNKETVSGLRAKNFTPPHDFTNELKVLNKLASDGKVTLYMPSDSVDTLQRVFIPRIFLYNVKSYILRIRFVNYLMQKYHPRKF